MIIIRFPFSNSSFHNFSISDYGSNLSYFLLITLIWREVIVVSYSIFLLAERHFNRLLLLSFTLTFFFRFIDSLLIFSMMSWWVNWWWIFYLFFNFFIKYFFLRWLFLFWFLIWIILTNTPIIMTIK
jgi:hypothetical protein